MSQTIKVFLSIQHVDEFVEFITQDTFTSLEDRTKFVRRVLRQMKYSLPYCSIKDLEVKHFRPSQIQNFVKTNYPIQVWDVQPNKKYVKEYEYPF